jgi:hypothetical protein
MAAITGHVQFNIEHLPDQDSNPRSTTLEASTLTITPPMWFFREEDNFGQCHSTDVDTQSDDNIQYGQEFYIGEFKKNHVNDLTSSELGFWCRLECPSQ